MTTRLEIATHIYARLIVRDLHRANEKPQEIAHRALLFADALLLCDQQSAPIQPFAREVTPPQKQSARPMPPLSERINDRRTSRPTLH